MDKTSIQSLSQEIVDEIVDHLADSRQDLDACSKTSRVFLYRCQKHLFSSIYFSSDRFKRLSIIVSPRKARIRKLLDIFRQSPYIARYIHGLHLDISSSDNDWVAEDPEFTSALETIKRSGSNIRELKLRGLIFPEKFADARSLEQNFLLPFISASLTTLDISYMVNIPMSLIANSPNIKNLSLHYSALEHFGEHIDMDLIMSLPKIHTLQYRPPDTIIGSMIGPDNISPSSSDDGTAGHLDIGIQSIITYNGIDTPNIADISSLKIFKTFTEPKHLSIIQRIIQTAKNSLEELYLSDDGEEEIHALEDSIDLSGLSQLRILYVDVVIPFPPSGGDVNVMGDLCTVLETIPQGNCVQKLALQAYSGSYNRKSISDWVENSYWEGLDSQIVRIAGGRPFQFLLHICHQPPHSADSESDSDSDHSSWEDRLENSVRLRACTTGRERSATLHEICKLVFLKLLTEDLPQVMGSSNITVIPTYSIRTPYHYWAPQESHVKNVF